MQLYAPMTAAPVNVIGKLLAKLMFSHLLCRFVLTTGLWIFHCPYVTVYREEFKGGKSTCCHFIIIDMVLKEAYGTYSLYMFVLLYRTHWNTKYPLNCIMTWCKCTFKIYSYKLYRLFYLWLLCTESTVLQLYIATRKELFAFHLALVWSIYVIGHNFHNYSHCVMLFIYLTKQGALCRKLFSGLDLFFIYSTQVSQRTNEDQGKSTGNSECGLFLVFALYTEIRHRFHLINFTKEFLLVW